MRAWVVRGVVLALVHAAVQTGEAWVRAGNPEAVSWLRPVALGVLVAVAVVWAGIDGWRSGLVAGGDSDGDGSIGRPRYGMVWFKAAILAGPVGGMLGVIGQGVFVDDTGVEALPVAITGGAAFIALLVLVPAGVGLLIGHLVTPAADSAPATPPTPESPRTGR
ncbi:B-4DMT family transporter [Kutzneria buriramensis]|uniref:Uncharacterized protein n=1 Tax=Kutzneria buriramensis TaxID=1045776 RepID=A0A3E0HG17_9PSEU|nr:B-4DMT family transporter [Kutzneria buriramensis]REH44740.1 hypothetical protein BCF44_108220 [Kutzneria buriramensis]